MNEPVTFLLSVRRTNTGCAALLHYLILSPKTQSAMTGHVWYVVLCVVCLYLLSFLAIWLFIFKTCANKQRNQSELYLRNQGKRRAKRQKKNEKKGKQMTWRERVAADGGFLFSSTKKCKSILYCISPHNLTLNTGHFSITLTQIYL